jgi:hypothetical protein
VRAEAPTESVRRERPPAERNERERDRDLAYALNPDQPPVPARSHAPGAQHGQHRGSKAKQLPALLMKRPAREPENA